MPCAPAGLTAEGLNRLSCQMRRVKNSSGSPLSAAAWASVLQMSATEGRRSFAGSARDCPSDARAMASDTKARSDWSRHRGVSSA